MAGQVSTSKTVTPADSEQLAAVVEDCFNTDTPVYPVGGATSLDYGVPGKRSGIALSLGGMKRVIDYPARDMTITVEAGLTMRELAETLASERQQLPIDVPQAAQATIGGVIATNWNGPRRYGLGCLRDYVIGISAVDGRGMPFKGGGRVVKNVAGYDFCKLLTGSLGVLGVITQVTLRVRPLPERSVLLAAAVSNGAQAENLIAGLNNAQATPVSVLLLAGPEWQQLPVFSGLSSGQGDPLFLLAGLEGSTLEVDWMQDYLLADWRSQGVPQSAVLETDFVASSISDGAWHRVVEWPAAGEAALVVKANLRSSGVVPFVNAVREIDPQCSILSHAGNGLVFVKYPNLPEMGLSKAVIGKLQPAAASSGGGVVVLKNSSGAEMTQQSVWGGNSGVREVMQDVKRNFDPKGILNPGRFVI